MDVDVTQRVKLEKELIERMELFHARLQTTPVGIGLARRSDNRMLVAKRAGYALFQRDPAEPWDETESWENLDDMKEPLAAIRC